MTHPRPTLAGDQRALRLERPVAWLVTLVVVAAVVGSVVLYAEDVRRTSPDADFAVSFDEETRTVAVEHAGGQAITDRTTERLTVVLVDESAGTTSTVTWASDTRGPTSRGTGYPVVPGDAIEIDDPTVDADGDENVFDADATVGFALEAGDTVRVVWTGNRQGGDARTVVLANATLGG